MNIILKQNSKSPTQKDIDKYSQWLVVLPEKGLTSAAANLPVQEEILNKRKSRVASKRNGAVITLDLISGKRGILAFAVIKPDLSAFERLTLARKLVASMDATDPRTVAIVFPGLSVAQQEIWSEALIAALLASAVDLPSYKSDRKKVIALREIRLYGNRFSHAFKRTFAEAEGNALARCLTLLPPNILTPASYRKRITKLASENKWEMDFFGIDRLKKKKAGAFLAVAQGSPEADAGIVRLRYQPSGKSRKRTVSLVGKGICYDTGGTNLKPHEYMMGMHGDMQGSAVALGTFLALTRLKVNFPVECWLALATNHIGSKAYKPDDVVTAANGTTIEVVHTDAEGRMVLADTLVLASREKPSIIIDYATLTGACVYSLSDAYSGVFSNRENWIMALIETGRICGERVWPFPQDKDYDQALDSDIADIKQCAVKGNADHILAARFLNRFIENDVPWLHMDLSSSTHKGGLGHIPTEVTGFGVRYTLNLLLDQRSELGI